MLICNYNLLALLCTFYWWVYYKTSLCKYIHISNIIHFIRYFKLYVCTRCKHLELPILELSIKWEHFSSDPRSILLGPILLKCFLNLYISYQYNFYFSCFLMNLFFYFYCEKHMIYYCNSITIEIIQGF